MKFIIQTKELLTALQITGKAIKNSVVPIVECARLEVSKKKCIVTGSNFELFITKTIDCKADGVIDICISNSKLTSYLRELPEQPLNFEVDELNDGYLVTITDSQGHCKLPGFKGIDYPLTPVIYSEAIEIETASFHNAILRTIFAASTDSSMVFSASLIEFGNGIKTTSADGRQIAIKSFSDKVMVDKQCLVKPFILNTIAVMELSDKVSISYSDTNILFDYGACKVFARLSEGKYPDCSKFIPTAHPIVVEFNVAQLASAIRRVMVFSDKLSEHIRYDLSDGVLVVSAEDVKLNEAGKQSVSVDYTGEGLSIGFLGKQMLSILSNLQTETGFIYFLDEKTVMMVKETKESEDLYLNVPSVLVS